MGATTSTLENDIESSVRKLFENNIYEEGAPLPISSAAAFNREYTTSTHAPGDIYLTIVDSPPDRHIQHMDIDYNYNSEYLTVDSPQIQHNNTNNDNYNYSEYLTRDATIGIQHYTDNNDNYISSEHLKNTDLADEVQLNDIYAYDSGKRNFFHQTCTGHKASSDVVSKQPLTYCLGSRQKNGDQKDLVKKYQVLYKAALKGDWDRAQRIFKVDPSALTASITVGNETALHIAAASGHSMFVEKLVALMPSDALELKNCDGETTLHFVAAAGLIRAAKAMVTKNPNLTQMRDNNEWVPLVTAAYSANSSNERSKEMVKYLCSVTRDEEPSPYYGVSGGTLICICIATSRVQISDNVNKKLYIVHLTKSPLDSGLKFLIVNVALYLVQRFPNLATEKSEDGYCALEAMAERPSAFPSGNERTLWQQFLYSFRSAKQIHDEELMQKHALALVKCICKQISLKSSTEIFKIFTESDALELATRFGAVEIVVECVQTFPDLMCIRMKTNMTVLEEAIKYRREKIFNLICEMNADKKMASFVYDENNTILHWVAKLANPQSLNSVSGSALQMQRELQWFKYFIQEVEKITLQRHRQKKNDEGKTGRDLFTEEHKELLEKAEKWMKDTANSCMLVATLITTVVFAAAFTVPGGNNSDNSSNNNGIPIFLNTTSFAVFAIADASALFSSITAVLMFFSILSSRYSEDDFLYSLPKRLTIGYANLFFSIATMIVAFGAALSIVLQPRWTWIPVPIALFACVPVTLFALLQLPLFVTLVRSTYGPSIFRREDQRMKWSY
ncbi:hypothetical protein C5167_028186 [Papaver somniferum]|nr:hypothetical protein C5167_028186 [Papaver somniferum]